MCVCMHACVHDYVSVGSVSLLVFGYLILCYCFCVVVAAVSFFSFLFCMWWLFVLL